MRYENVILANFDSNLRKNVVALINSVGVCQTKIELRNQGFNEVFTKAIIRSIINRGVNCHGFRR